MLVWKKGIEIWYRFRVCNNSIVPYPVITAIRNYKENLRVENMDIGLGYGKFEGIEQGYRIRYRMRVGMRV